jgi:cysteine desulfurase
MVVLSEIKLTRAKARSTHISKNSKSYDKQCYNYPVSEIYLDNAASTPIDPQVLDVLIWASRDVFGNPSNTKNEYGKLAKKVLETSRKDIAKALGLSPSGIIFTSGATEANNLALRGPACLQDTSCSVLISQIEHKCIDESIRFLLKRGVTVKSIPTQSNGQIDLAAAEKLITTLPNLHLVSVMAVNNETGVIQPINEIIRIAHQNGVLVHVDAVQALGKLNPSQFNNADLISLSAHKINGPKGIGLLWVRPSIKVSPLLVGGGQEAGLRSGTCPVPSIAAFARAVNVAYEDIKWLDTITPYMRQLEKAVIAATGAKVNGEFAPRVGNITNLSFPYPKLVIDSLTGVAASAGAACGCSVPKPSKVLLAMGLSDQEATNSLRLSAGKFTTPVNIIAAQNLIINAALKSQNNQ